MKSEVYSWRIDPALRRALEDEARRLGTSLAEVLDTIAASWLSQQQASDDDADQDRRHGAAAKWIGSIHSDGATNAATKGRARSTNVRALTRKRLTEKRSRGRV